MKTKYLIIRLFSMLIILILFTNLVLAMAVTVNIPEKYSEVQAGEKVYFETDVKWPENTQRSDLRIEYNLKDKNGNEIAYLKVLKAIETQASFMDSISIPESTKSGTYTLFLTLTDYKELNQEVAASFKVIKKQTDNKGYYLAVIVVVLIIVSIILIFSYKKIRALLEKMQIKMRVKKMIRKRKL